MDGDRKRLGWTGVIAEAPSRGRVLVVDDDPDVRRSLARLLTGFGHAVQTASSAEQADQWMSSEAFDVCLLDIELPGMRGVEFLEWALLRDPEMAVIMLTGLDAPEVAVQCIDRGARTYLVKPVDPDFLRLALRDALAVQAILRQRNDLTVPPTF
jgi:DNA-binding NtrC family response regulator